MNGYKLKHMTPYYQKILGKLREVAAHKGMIGQGELLAQLNLTKTKSFYRAMTQAEMDGVVSKAYYLTEKGGRAVGYEVHVELTQMRLPFENGIPF